MTVAAAGRPRTAARPGGATVLGVLAFATAAITVLALGRGAMAVPPGEILAILARALGGPFADAGADTGAGAAATDPGQAARDAVILSVRLPRVLSGLAIGAALASAGAALQGLFRNPLADPGLIGVSAGAALGAMSVIVLGPALLAAAPALQALPGSEMRLLPPAAFLGGLVATWTVHRFAARDGEVATATLLLAGIAIAATAQAGTGLLTYLADDMQLRTLTFWSLGSLGTASWARLGYVAPALVLGTVFVAAHARALDALLLGESEARHLGFEVERIKRRLLVGVAIVVGAAVAVSGIIGFVGLVTPHLVRLVAGPGHRLLLPASALLGAALLVGADLVARTVLAPAELPIGIVTALFGGPFFLWLLVRERDRGRL